MIVLKPELYSGRYALRPVPEHGNGDELAAREAGRL